MREVMEHALSRRRFVQSTGAVMALPLAALTTRLQAQVKPQASSTLKVGLIGCGGRGTGAAVQALNADNGCVLTAMGDVFPDRLDDSLRRLTQHFGDTAAQRIRVPKSRRFVGFDAFQKVSDSDVDVVLLTTPPGFRPQHLKAAVDAGKHVFCEKPVAVDAPGIRSVLESAKRAEEKKLSLVSGFCWRYSDAERAAFRKVSDGAIRDVITVHSTYHTCTLGKRPRKPDWSDMEFQLRNWWHFTWLSGDHLVEQACHSVDRLAWATGDKTPMRCVALGGRAARSGPEHGNVFDHFTVIYEYEDGTRAFLTTTQIDNTPADNTDYIYGRDGSIEVCGFKPLHLMKNAAGKVTWRYDGPYNDMYQTEHDELFASIRNPGGTGNSGGPINDGKWMAHSTMMAIMGRMAAYTGQTISWEQAMNSRENLSPTAEQMQFGELPVAKVAVPGVTKFV